MMLALLALVFALASPVPQPPPASPSPFGGSAVPAPGQATPGQPTPGQSAPDPGTASIKGRIVGKDSGAPLRHASVHLYGGTAHENKMTATDDQGRFTFTDLQGGRYTIMASKGGYVSLQYGQKDRLEPGRPLELTPAQQLDKIDFALPRGGVITGEIVDDAGEPVTGAVVRPMTYRYVDGSRRLAPSNGADQTDDRGIYRLFGLSPGTYYVVASWNARMMNGESSGSQTGYAPTFYPGTADAGMAARVTVDAGQEVSGVSFAIASTRTSTIAGRVIDASGQPVGRTTVFLRQVLRGANFATSGIPHVARTDPDGTFKMTGVTPGNYTLIARQGRPNSDDSEMGSVPVTVAGADVLGLTVTLSHGATITGTITIDGDQKAPFVPKDLMVEASPPAFNGLPMGRTSSRPNDDWTFELKNVMGPERFFVGSLPDGWGVKSVHYNGQDITDTGADFSGEDRASGLQIVLTNKLTDVSGMVTDENSKPLTDYTLVIFPVDQQRWGTRGRYTRLMRPDQNGRFEAKGLPPSEYYAVAVASIEQGSETDPDVLQQLSTRATKFTLGEGESKSLTLTVQARP